MMVAEPLASLARASEHERRDEHHGWRAGYYHRPDIYYSAPPVVSPPRGYYLAPGATFSVSIPVANNELNSTGPPAR
jgi:hypothetical protein